MLPEHGDDVFKPLDWLTNDLAAEVRCLPVDGAEERFNEFTAAFADPGAWLDKGHVVLVTGDKGFGKTSLIRRCAAWLRDQAASGQQYRLIVVNLSDARWGNKESVEVRMRRTLERMLDNLGLLIAEADHARIKGRAGVPDQFYDLSVQLAGCRDDAGLPVVVAVLLEGYPIPAEVTEYYNNADKGMFFFAEMFRPGDVAEVSDSKEHFNRNSARFRDLHLDAVKPADLRTFAEWIRSTGSNWPPFDEPLLDELGTSLPRRKVGVLELAKMMWGALLIAAKQGSTIVSSIHVIEYYAELAGNNNNFLEP